MRVPKIVIVSIAFLMHFVLADEVRLHKMEDQLSSVLQWEILWKQSPAGFHLPPGGSAKIAIQSTTDSIAYCSHDLGACVRYQVLGYRNWLEVSSTRCDDVSSDLDALLVFIGMGPQHRANSQLINPSSRGADVRGLGGLSPTGTGTLWTTAINLGSRDDIIQRYRRMNPGGIEGLRKWAAAGVADGIKSIRIPCYAPSDPLVFLYFEWQTKEATAKAVFWDREQESWRNAASFVGPEFRVTIEAIHSVIESVTCATIKPE